MEEEKNSMSTGRKILIVLIAVLLLLTAAAYGYGVYYFSGHFLPGSLVNGFNCSYMDQKEAEELLAKKTAAYVLAVRTRGNGQESISAEEIDLAYKPDGSVKKLMHDQKRFLWFMAFSQHSVMETASSVTYDEELFQQKFSALKCLQDNQQPTDAYIEDNGKEFVIVPEIQGTLVNQEKLQKTVIKAVTTGNPVVDLEEDGCYINPEICQDDKRLVEDCKQMNELTDMVITYDFSDRKETIDRNVIRSWLSRNKEDDLVLDKEKIASYIKTLAEKYDTIGAERSFATYDNRKISVIGGDYGWVIDQEKETEALYQAVSDKVTQVREPIYLQTAMSRNINDIGYTYVEIDLPRQRLVVYHDGNPVADTGIYASGETETGIYTTGQMQSPADLSGGTVNFLIPYGEGKGIVDNPALTQSDVGGWTGEILDEEILADFSSGESSGESSGLWSASAGYIEVPGDRASEVYQCVKSGMPIVIYK